MLTTLDRLTVYSVLCFISFCALVSQTTHNVSLLPLIGMSASVIGIWLEMRRYDGAAEEQEY